MKIFFISLCLMAISIGCVFAQKVTYDYFGNKVGPVTANDLSINGYAASTALPEVQNILREIGLQIDIKVQQDDSRTSFAFAKTVNGERYIFFNRAFMDKVAQGGYWDAVSILAHEVGHHLGQHSETGNRHFQNELAADRFSGFILGKLGASLESAQRALNIYTVQLDDNDLYPGKAKRLFAVSEGWKSGASMRIEKIPNSVEPPKPKTLNKDISSVRGVLNSTYKGKSKGQRRYDFELSLTGIGDIKDNISKVVYDFNHPSYTTRYITAENREANFLIDWEGWGCIENLGVYIYFVDGTNKSMVIDMCELWN